MGCGSQEIRLLAREVENYENGFYILEEMFITKNCDIESVSLTGDSGWVSKSIILRGPGESICRIVRGTKTYYDKYTEIPEGPYLHCDPDEPIDPACATEEKQDDDDPIFKMWIAPTKKDLLKSLGEIHLATGEVINSLGSGNYFGGGEAPTGLVYRSFVRGPRHVYQLKIPYNHTTTETQDISLDTAGLSISIQFRVSSSNEGRTTSLVEKATIDTSKVEPFPTSEEITLNFEYLHETAPRSPLARSTTTRSTRAPGISKLVGSVEPVIAVAGKTGEDEEEERVTTKTEISYKEVSKGCYRKAASTTATWKTFKVAQFFSTPFLVPPVITSNPVATFCKAVDVQGMTENLSFRGYVKKIEESYKCSEDPEGIGVDPFEDIPSGKPKRAICLALGGSKTILVHMRYTVFTDYGNVGGISVTIEKSIGPFGDYAVKTSASFSAGPRGLSCVTGIRGYFTFVSGNVGTPVIKTVGNISVTNESDAQMIAENIIRAGQMDTNTCVAIGSPPECPGDYVAQTIMDYIANRGTTVSRSLPSVSVMRTSD